MVAAVQAPQQREDSFTKLMKGVQLATSILGLKQGIDKEFEEKPVEDKNLLSQKDLLSFEKDYMVVPKGTEGAREYRIAGIGGKPPEFVSLARRPPELSLKDQTLLDRDKEEREQKEQDRSDRLKRINGRIEESKKIQRTKQEKDMHETYWKEGGDKTSNALTAFRKVEAAANSDDPTGATDMTLLFNYIKTLDPSSTVMQGEYAAAEETKGVPETVLGLYNRSLKGEKLTPLQREQFYNAAKNQIKVVLEEQIDDDKRFSEWAKSDGLNIDKVINPQFQQAYDLIVGKNQQQQYSEFNKPVQTRPGETRGVTGNFGDQDINETINTMDAILDYKMNARK
jgi:hypothetical protein